MAGAVTPAADWPRDQTEPRGTSGVQPLNCAAIAPHPQIAPISSGGFGNYQSARVPSPWCSRTTAEGSRRVAGAAHYVTSVNSDNSHPAGAPWENLGGSAHIGSDSGDSQVWWTRRYFRKVEITPPTETMGGSLERLVPISMAGVCKAGRERTVKVDVT